MNEVIRAYVAASMLLIAGSSVAGEWEYIRETGRLRHNDSGWILRVEADGKALSVTGWSAAPTDTLPLNDPVAGGYHVVSIGDLEALPALRDVYLPPTLTRFGHLGNYHSKCLLTSLHLGKSSANRFELESNRTVSITVDNNNPWLKEVEGAILTRDGSLLVRYPPQRPGKRYVVPDGVKAIQDFAFMDNPYLEEIVLPDSLESIGEKAFYYCTSLAKLDLPSSVSTLGERAFMHCQKLEQMVIPQRVRKLPAFLFANNSNLRSVKLPSRLDPDGLGVALFKECVKLESLYLPDGPVTLPLYLVYGCKSLSYLRLPDTAASLFFPPLGVKSARLIVGGCDSLRNLVIPSAMPFKELPEMPDSITHFEVAEANPTLRDIDGILYSKDGKRLLRCLENREGEVVIPDGVETISKEAFDGCEKLTSIVIPNTVHTIGPYAFCGCKGVKEFDIPPSVKRIETGAFISCTNLTTITIPPSATNFGGFLFVNCTNLKDVQLPNTITSISGLFGSCDALEEVVIPNSVKRIGMMTFMDCKALKRVIIPDSVTSLGDRVFEGCTFLETLHLPDSITRIGSQAFEGCYALRNLRRPASLAHRDDLFPNFPPSSVAQGALYAMDGTTLLKYPKELTATSYTVPEGTLKIEPAAFSYNEHLESVTVPDSVVEIGHNAFSGCKKLRRVRLPAKLRTISQSLFRDARSLTEVVFPEAPETVGYGAFFSTSLQTDSLPDSIKTIANGAFARTLAGPRLRLPRALEGIGMYAFSDCNSLEEVLFPENIKYIRRTAFAGCSKLRSAEIPESLEYLGDGAFANCSGLQALIFNGSYPANIGVNILQGSHSATTYVARAYGESWDTDVSFGPIGAANSVWQGRPIVYVGADVSRQRASGAEAGAVRQPPGPLRDDIPREIPEELFDRDSDGDGMSDGDEIIAGTDPRDPDSIFRALIYIRDGEVTIHWTPGLGDKRVYTVQGKKNLDDAEWISPATAECRFFRVLVALPPTGN